MALSLSPADKQSENRPPGSTESMASSSQNRPPGSPKSAFHSALSHFQNRSRLQLTASSFQKRPPGSPKSVFRSAASRFRNRPPARPMASRFQNRNQRVRAGTSVNPARKMLPGNKRREAEGSELAVDALVNELRNFDLKEGPRVCLDSMEPPVTDRFQEVINDLKTLIYPDEPPSTSTQAVHTETKDSDSIETPLVVRVQEIINDLETFLNLDEPSSASIQAMHTETKDTMESPLSLRSQELVYGLETFLNLDEPSSTSTQAVPTEPRVNDKEKSAPVHVEAPKEVEDQKKKRNLNVVFIGHVGTGKSTIGGQILFLSGQVDDYTIQKYEKEAKNESRESWYMAYIMDTNEEERAKGKTVEVGRAHFETDTTRFAILEAQGHKTYVSNMVCGASQADIGVLVTSARKGEFETKYVKGGHSHEQVRLAKTLGVSKLIVVVNKMDHPTVNWSKTRYKKIVSDMTDILRNWYNMKEDVQFLPLSGLIGANMNKRMDKNICPWWDGPCLFEALDAVEVPPRDPSGPFRMPIIEKFQDMGIVVMGKLECGSVTEGDIILVMPNKTEVKVLAIYCDESKVRHDEPGEYVCVKLSSIADEYISSGFVLSSMARPIHAVTEFDADLQILELLDNGTFAVGYKAVLYIHSVIVGSEIVGLSKLDRRRHQRLERDFLFVKSWARVAVRIRVNDLICVENFLDFPQLGNFILRTEEGEPVAVGQVTGFPASDSVVPDAMKPDPEKFLHWLNEGSMEDLMKLKGVGKTYAQYIVKFREENPRPCPFERVEDLNKTRIRPNMVNRILKLNCKY